MFEAPDSPYLVSYEGDFDISKANTKPQTGRHSHTGKHRRAAVGNLSTLQQVLAAGDRHAILLVFQAMDAAGKDSTIRAVMRGIDPSSCQVFSFKKPSSLELDHDFLWRTTCRLPERGRIGIFNRSQYEEVLVVRVHPGILANQQLPGVVNLDTVFDDRLQSIRQQEEHLARNGTVILKFWLNVSKGEQKRRFLARLDDPAKHWKFETGDVVERRHWDDYMQAYEAALNATSRSWA
ncbi:MAG: polyphosphate kinase 2 family protein, partial [Woeseiaceae bacterium]|nr:polyphosphate kinase 2 family protein [Woeseiaceae bacterium]